MSKRAKAPNEENHKRQMRYLRKGIVMLPTLKEEIENGKKK